MSYSYEGRPGRPRPTSGPRGIDRALGIGALLGVAVGLIVLAVAWPGLPERAPTHFGFSGRPDAWGDKSSLLFLPILSVALYLLLGVVAHFPHHFNYPWPITPRNAQRQYQLARTFMATLRLELCWLFTYLLWGSMVVAQGASTSLGGAFVWVFLTVLAATIGLYLLMASAVR